MTLMITVKVLPRGCASLQSIKRLNSRLNYMCSFTAVVAFPPKSHLSFPLKSIYAYPIWLLLPVPSLMVVLGLQECCANSHIHQIDCVVRQFGVWGSWSDGIHISCLYYQCQLTRSLLPWWNSRGRRILDWSRWGHKAMLWHEGLSIITVGESSNRSLSMIVSVCAGCRDVPLSKTRKLTKS